MKIEMPPWDDSYTVNVDELYTELTLEQIENKPRGPTSVKLENYTQLFEQKITDTQQEKPTQDVPQRPNTRKQKGKKILAKGELGMGKSTFCKKIAYDWAKGVFTAVSVVFFVSMKLIRPGQSIENIIIDQTPVIEGLGVDEPKLKSILDGFGNKILLIFDGLDEHDLGRNEDVKKIVEGRKLLHCNFLLTSRTQGIEKVGKYFPTHVRIEGFSKEHAEHFISHCTKNSEKTIDLLDFHRNNFAFIHVHSICFCPLLLLFMCILFGNDEVRIAEKLIPIGEIYMRLVRFIYGKYCTQKDKKLDKTRFVTVLKSLGKIAWHMLKSGQGWVKQDDVMNNVGDEDFAFCLLTRHKDSELSMHETTDKQLTFGHVTIQEFLGSLGFLQLLDNGESVHSILDNTAGQIVMQNPFFLRFCLWFLDESCRKEYFEFKNRDNIYEALLVYASSFVNVVQLQMREIAETFHVLQIPLAESEENSSIVKFIQGVLSKCDRTQELYFGSSSYYPITGLAELLRSFPPHAEGTDSSEKTLTLVESSTNHIALRKMLDCCDTVGLQSDLLLESGIHTDIADCMHHSIRKLSLFNAYTFTSSVTGGTIIPLCPFLTELSLEYLDIDVSVMTALNSAVRDSFLPLLSDLSFAGCWTSLTGKLSNLFHSKWPTLTHLNLFDCLLDQNDITTLTGCFSMDSTVLESLSVETTHTGSSPFNILFQKALSNVKTLSV